MRHDASAFDAAERLAVSSASGRRRLGPASASRRLRQYRASPARSSGSSRARRSDPGRSGARRPSRTRRRPRRHEHLGDDLVRLAGSRSSRAPHRRRTTPRSLAAARSQPSSTSGDRSEVRGQQRVDAPPGAIRRCWRAPPRRRPRAAGSAGRIAVRPREVGADRLAREDGARRVVVQRHVVRGVSGRVQRRRASGRRAGSRSPSSTTRIPLCGPRDHVAEQGAHALLAIRARGGRATSRVGSARWRRARARAPRRSARGKRRAAPRRRPRGPDGCASRRCGRGRRRRSRARRAPRHDRLRRRPDRSRPGPVAAVEEVDRRLARRAPAIRCRSAVMPARDLAMIGRDGSIGASLAQACRRVRCLRR